MADASAPEISEAWDAVRSNAKEETWLVLTYEGEKSNKLQLAATGKQPNPLGELKDHLRDDCVAYAYAKITFANDKESTREKFIFITWIGEKVGVMRKARVSTHKGDVQNVLRAYSIEVPASSIGELDEDSIVTRLQKAGGAYYGPGR